MRLRTRDRGFTLLEVLIAVLIFSLGLLGVAGLMVLSVRTNHSAYLRTQATFLAQSMADRIRSNTGKTLSYNGTYDASSAGTGCSANCTPDDVVARDKAVWSQQLVDLLPNTATASIQCNGTQLGSGAQIGAAPFDGLCTMIITWPEYTLERPTSSGATPVGTEQKFAWVFQP